MVSSSPIKRQRIHMSSAAWEAGKGLLHHHRHFNGAIVGPQEDVTRPLDVISRFPLQRVRSTIKKAVLYSGLKPRFWMLVVVSMISFLTMTSADVTTSTWSTEMTQYHARGSYYISTTNSGTSSAEMQLVSYYYTSTCNAVYKEESPQSASGGGFTLSFQIKIATYSNADSIYAFIGTSKVPTTESPTDAGTGMVIAFDVYKWNPPGIYLTKTTSSANSKLATYSSFSASGSWESVTITYTPSSTNTWKVRTYFGSFLPRTLLLVYGVC
jgi:hypothetical protein